MKKVILAIIFVLTIFAFAQEELLPVAEFSFSPESPECGQSIQFDGSASYHQDSDHFIIKYEWDFDALESYEFKADAEGKIQNHYILGSE